jgi:diguanylate cyclase
MEGLTLLPFPSVSAGAPALSTDLLAIIVAIVAFCLSGIFLLFLVPDPDRASSIPIATATTDLAPTPIPEMTEAPASVPAALRDSGNNGNGAHPEFGRGTYSPLGGMGGPPRRFARHLPIERDGGTQFLSVDDVVAIHANSHYTFIFNGTDKLFCPLAIGEVESRLDNSRFVRIHRSHIVNIERVIGYKRSGDNELVEMDAAHDYAVPVSRSRIGWLKTRVAAIMGTEPAAALRRRHHLAPQ